MVILDSFVFDKLKKHVVKRTHKKLKLLGDQELLVTMLTTTIDKMDVDLIVVAFVGVT